MAQAAIRKVRFPDRGSWLREAAQCKDFSFTDLQYGALQTALFGMVWGAEHAKLPTMSLPVASLPLGSPSSAARRTLRAPGWRAWACSLSVCAACSGPAAPVDEASTSTTGTDTPSPSGTTSSPAPTPEPLAPTGPTPTSVTPPTAGPNVPSIPVTSPLPTPVPTEGGVVPAPTMPTPTSDPTTPVTGAGGTPPASTGSGGMGSSGMSNAGMGSGGMPVGEAGSGTAGGGGSAPLPMEGEVLFSEDFEAQTVGQKPSGWDDFVAWNKNMANPAGETYAIVGTEQVFGGSNAIHFKGGGEPAQITRPLPEGTNRLYISARVWMSRQLGQNPGANHETLIGIRGTTGGANDEIRFGEIKGVIGTNEVPSDNITPLMDQWGMGPVVPANTWACFEVAFIADQPQHELHAWVNGELVHSATAPEQWQNSPMPPEWMTGKFTEVVFGWHSFSSANAEVWMDDIVVATGRRGCP